MAEDDSGGGNSPRGFAAMPKKKRQKIASMGGQATGGKNLSHEDRVRGGQNSRRRRQNEE